MRDISNWLAGQRLRKSTRDFDLEDIPGVNAHLAKRGALCDPSETTFMCKLSQRPKPKRKDTKPTRKKTMAKRKLSGQSARKKYKYAAGDLVDFTHPKKGEGSGLIMSRSYEAAGGYGGPNLPHYTLRSEFGIVMIPEHLIDGPIGQPKRKARKPAAKPFRAEFGERMSDEDYLVALAEIAEARSAFHKSSKRTTMRGTKKKVATKRKTRKSKPPASRTSGRKAPAKLSAKDYFNMGKNDLVALGDAGAIKELKRRGRGANGKKIR